MNLHAAPASDQPFVASAGGATIANGRARWSGGALWLVRATASETAGRYALLEAMMPHGLSAPPHLHERDDESFTVLEGELLFSLGEGDDERVVRAAAGAFVWIPRGTAHAFRVESESAHVLNAYAPAGFEEMILAQSVPARSLSLPPSADPPYSRELSPGERRALHARLGLTTL